MKGKSSISKLKLLASLFYKGRSALKNVHTKIYIWQRKLAEFIKERRTVKLLHLLRNYSALVVVVSSALLVASTNIAAGSPRFSEAGKSSSGFLFSYFVEEESPATSKKIDAQSGRKSDLSLVPLSQVKDTVDPRAEDEEEVIAAAPFQERALMEAASMPLREPAQDGGVEIYTVQSGDTAGAIAEKFGITVNTIYWANDIEDIDSLMPGDKIFILPVAGINHKIKSGDTIDSIAKEYDIEAEKIIAFNDLPADGTIEVGGSIVIPGAQKEIPTPEPVDSYLRQYATSTGGTPAVSGWKKLEGKAGAGYSFPYGYCTWYVSQRRYIPWRGNAGTWLYSAKSMGYKTGKSPAVGAIIVTAESWWGHVGIVEKVGGGSVTISEMNYNGWGKVNKRTLSAGSRVIKGYIY